MIRFLRLALPIVLFAAGAASAAETKAPAKLLQFAMADEDVQEGMFMSIQLGVLPPTFPADDIAKIKTPTARFDFMLGGKSYTVFGKDDDSPPRWATSTKDKSAIAYLCLMPRPAPALDWYRKYQKDKDTTANFTGPDDMMFSLIIARGNKRDIYAFYDRIPDDTPLTAAMTDALSGKTPVKVNFDVVSGSVDFEPN